MKLFIRLFFVFIISFQLLSFPYKVKFHLKSHIKKRYFPQKAWQDFEYFLNKTLPGNNKIGVILLQIDHPKTYFVFLDGTVETKITSEISFNSGRLIDITRLKQAYKIPLNDSLRKRIVNKYNLDGFIAIEILDSGMDEREWIDINKRFIKRKITFYYKMVAKIFDKNGKLIYFDILTPEYTIEAYYKRDIEKIGDISTESLTQIEMRENFRYNPLKGTEKNIW